MHKSHEIRVRIAPSPTGNLHIGTARAALFNWLYARREGGKFILRIEDTDLERSDKKFEKNIIEGLRWLGLNWDEGPDVLGAYGPYRQSERLDTYEKYINKLLSEDWAYYCACSKEKLDEERQRAIAAGKPQIYSGQCRDKKNQTGELIRFKMPIAEVAFKDLIRGNITFDGALMGDFAIAKNPRTPLYNFAVVVDDIEMKITQVIRGEDHIGNTPKQIAIFRALEKTPPEYAHLPLVLDKDRAKLSKRFSAVSVDEYRQEGFLEDTLVNFLALLGWHPEGDQEIMNRDELVARFSLGRVQKGGAVFDIEKLKWMNAQYLKKMTNSELLSRVRALMPYLTDKINENFIELTRGRVSTLRDFEAETAFLLKIGEYQPELLIWKNSDISSTRKMLETIKEKLINYGGDFQKSGLDAIFAPLANELGRGEVFWPFRVALSGLKASPGPLEIAAAIGKDESIKRIDLAISKLQ